MRGSTRGSTRCCKAGALDEVAALAARKLDPLLPAMKAHGVPALIRHLNGEITLEEAAVIGRADTRHYAKRQFTWFRHQLPEFEWVRPEAAFVAAQARHSGARVARTRNPAKLPEPLDSGSACFARIPE